jgi:hypothetical protein
VETRVAPAGRWGGELSMAGRARHGHTADYRVSPTYRSWICMKSRCNDVNDSSYFRYGAKGVRVCARWEVFENFLADMGERPKDTTLGRHNDIGNYEPGNCSWQTRKEQAKCGAANGKAVLTEEQVLCLRALYKPKARRGCSAKNMAADLGMSFTSIAEILRYKTWRHI